MSSKKPDLWLIGCKGMLGNEVAEKLKDSNIAFYESDRDVDITEKTAVEDYLEDKEIKVIINCAAYTAVDRAEDDEKAAHRLNTTAPNILARNAKRIGARLIHVSTDYVFNGTKNTPLTENEQTDPIGVYGRTKRDGETAIQSAGCRFDLVRTAWLYGFHGPNFITTMIRLMNEKDTLRVVNDQTGTPTWAKDLAEFLVFLSRQPNRDSAIYHFSNEGRITWYDFAQAIYNEGQSRGLIDKKNVTINPCTSDEYPTRATRPCYSLLSKEKIKQEFGWVVPEWYESLKKYMDSLGDLYSETL